MCLGKETKLLMASPSGLKGCLEGRTAKYAGHWTRVSETCPTSSPAPGTAQLPIPPHRLPLSLPVSGRGAGSQGLGGQAPHHRSALQAPQGARRRIRLRSDSSLLSRAGENESILAQVWGLLRGGTRFFNCNCQRSSMSWDRNGLTCSCSIRDRLQTLEFRSKLPNSFDTPTEDSPCTHFTLCYTLAFLKS